MVFNYITVDVPKALKGKPQIRALYSI